MKQAEQTLGVWQYFMLVLSIASLALLAVETFVAAAGKATEALRITDNIICLVFFGDFISQLVRTRPHLAYLKWGWLDLVSSIPIVPVFRLARLARVARIIRLLRGARASKHLFAVILIHRARNTFAVVVFGSFVLLLFSVLAILTVEPSMAPRDAFWWCLFTLITGEYGEFFPASTEGRIITVSLTTAGVALFGTFTASVAAFFLEEDQEDDERRDAEILRKIGTLTEEVAELRKQIRGDATHG